MSRILGLGFLCLMFLMNGCVNVLPEPSESIQKIKLGGVGVNHNPTSKIPAHVIVGEVTGRDFLNTSRIVVEKNHPPVSTLDFYANIEWEDTLPKVIQRDFRNTLSHGFSSVSLEEEVLKGDYLIHCDLESFQSLQKEIGSPSAVQLSWHLKVIKLPARTVMASQLFFVEDVLNNPGKAGVIEAFKNAYEKLLNASRDWVQNTLLKLE